jgi:hypothetical protein
MPQPTPKPFTRRGITFASQYAYRQFLAAERGFASPSARNKAVARAKSEMAKYSTGLTPEQRGVLAAGVADYRNRIGSYIQGLPPDQRGSSRLPNYLQQMIRDLGPNAYPIWRMLYR